MIAISATEFADEIESIPLCPGSLARAEALVAALSERYPELAAKSLAELNACWAAFHAQGGASAQNERREEFYRLAHDFKGVGGSYGYPLVSTIGELLCRLLGPEGTLDATKLGKIAGLVSALNLIISERLSGDGGDRGRHVMADL